MSQETLRSKARILISISNHLKPAYRTPEQITLRQIAQAASQWARKKRPSPSKRLGDEFVSEAVAWMSFLGRLQTQAKSARAYEHMLSEFRESWKRIVASLR